MKIILQKLLKLCSLVLLLGAWLMMPMEKDFSKDLIEFAPRDMYDKDFTYQNPFDTDRLGIEYNSIDSFKLTHTNFIDRYKETFEPLDVPRFSYDQEEQTHDHFKPLQDSMYKEDFGSLVDNAWDSSTATSASYYKTDKVLQIIAMERVQREKELTSIEQKLESLIDYNTSGNHFYARPLLTKADKDFSEFGPQINAALKDTIDDINEIVCYANGRFKGHLTQEEVNAISYIYADYLEHTRSVRGHNHYHNKLTYLAEKNNAFADALKKYEQSDTNRLLGMAQDVAHVISQPVVLLTRKIKKGYAAHIYSVSREARYNNVNQRGNLIAHHIKEGDYEIALELGKRGYFERYPLIAETIRQDCNRLIQERDAKRALLEEQHKADIIKSADYVFDQQKDQLKQISNSYKQQKGENRNQEEIIAARICALDELLTDNRTYTLGTATLNKPTKQFLSKFITPNKIGQFYGNQIQHVLHREIATLTEQAASLTHSTHTAKEANRILAYVLRAREAVDKGDILSSITYADKAWKTVYKNAEKESPLSKFAPSDVQLTPKLLNQKESISLSNQVQLLPQLFLEKELQLLPDAQKELQIRGVDVDTFMKSIHENLDKREQQQEIIKRVNATVLAKEQAKDVFRRNLNAALIDADIVLYEKLKSILTEKELQEARKEGFDEFVQDIFDEQVQIVDAAREQMLYNVKHPIEYLKRSFIDPFVQVDTYLKQYNVLSPLGRMQKLAQDISYGMKVVINSIKAFHSLHPEQQNALRGKIIGDMLTANIIGEIVAVFFNNPTIKTIEEVEQVIDQIGAKPLRIACDELKKTGWAPKTPAIIDHAKEGTDFANAVRKMQLPEVTPEIKSLLPAVQTGSTVAQITQEASKAVTIGQQIGKGVEAAIKISQTANAIQKVGKTAETALMTEEKARKIWAESKEFQELEARVAELKKVTSDTRIETHYTLDAKIDRVENLAQTTYENIRVAQNDVVKVSKNTGMSQECVKKIKDHVFIKEHNLQDGKGKFSADLDIADVWNRLANGEFVQSDLEWMKHEYAEALIMNEANIDWRTAHDIVNEKYNWQNLIG